MGQSLDFDSDFGVATLTFLHLDGRRGLFRTSVVDASGPLLAQQSLVLNV